jgi:hypothetical protein
MGSSSGRAATSSAALLFVACSLLHVLHVLCCTLSAARCLLHAVCGNVARALRCLLRDVLELGACGAQHDVVTEAVAVFGRQLVPEVPQPRLGLDLQYRKATFAGVSATQPDNIQTTFVQPESGTAADGASASAAGAERATAYHRVRQRAAWAVAQLKVPCRQRRAQLSLGRLSSR